MPVLNEEGYLADAVAAVLAQEYPADAELVLALGASTDATTAIAEELALPPVKIHCSILAEDAIKAAVSDYKQKHGLSAE